MREAFFSAVRSAIEAMARRNPLVLVFEDIHWADHGMLDLIEYLAQWVRGAADPALPGARRAARAPPAAGAAGAASATSILLDPLTASETRELVVVAAARRRATRGGRQWSPSAPAATRSSPRRWSRRLAEEGGSGGGELPDTVQGAAGRAARLARAVRASRWCSRRRWWAAPSGRARWRMVAARARAATSTQALSALQEKDIVVPGAGARLAGERELAFKHVLIRDVAYGMLPKAVRARKHFEVGRFIEERAGDRTDEVVALLAEHYGRAAIARRARRGVEADELEPIRAQGAPLPRGGGRRRGAALLEPRGVRPLPRPRASSAAAHDAGRRRARRREAGRRRAAAWGAWTRRSRCGRSASSTTASRRTSTASPTCTARSAPALWHKGERKQAIEHYQKGINLLKDGPPCLELVRLYEEAASLYMHAGDNMLAIYASEKALRLAERLGETRVASRAHGIFGRVFGRIGDTAKARENLERSVELARGSDDGETIRALLDARPSPRGLRGRLRRRRAAPTARRWRWREQVGDAARAGGAARPRSRRSPSYRADWDEVEALDRGQRRPRRARGPRRQALPTRTCCAACWRWREGGWEEAEQCCRRAHELAEQVGWSEVVVLGAVRAGAHAARPRRLHGRRHRARPRARRLRARRPDRAVDRGDVGARDHARDRRQAASRAARPPRRPATWPSACTTRSAARPP